MGVESSIIKKLSNTGFDLNVLNKSCLLDSYWFFHNFHSENEICAVS